MIKKILILTFFFVCFSNVSFAKVKPIEEQRKEWNEWLEELKEEMHDKGISKKTLKKAKFRNLEGKNSVR